MRISKKRLPSAPDTVGSDTQISNSATEAPNCSVVETINETAQNVNSATIGLGITGSHFSLALAALPQNVADLAREMPNIVGRLKRAGVRNTDLPRSKADILKLFDSIPATSKLGRDPQTTIWQFLKDKHASHIKPHSHGGSNNASNIVWENGVDNIRRGARTMTEGERVCIRVHNALGSILRNSGTIARMGLEVTLLATLS